MKCSFLHDKNILRAKNDRYFQEQIDAEEELIKLSDKVICSTKGVAAALADMYKNKIDNIYVVPNGIQDKCTQENKLELREKHYFYPTDKIILFAGQLDNTHGLFALIKAFRILVKKQNDCRLLIVGGGDFGTYINTIKDITARITFTGQIEQEVLFEYMNMADIGVIPSLYEPFGYTAIEMLMHGLPIVATSSLKDILDDGIDCQMIPLEYTDKGPSINYKLLARAIEKVLSSDISSKYVLEGRKKFEEKYEINNFRNNMLEIYNLRWKESNGICSKKI